MIGTSVGAVIDQLAATQISVEADVSQGLPQFHIVGLPDSAVSESKLRIRAAIRNTGWEFPNRRITVNLSPASMRKRGAGLDLAIATAILRAVGIVPQAATRGAPPIALCGELSLSGRLMPVRGLVSLALALRSVGVHAAIVSAEQRAQCVSVPDFAWYPVESLADAVRLLQVPHLPVAYHALPERHQVPTPAVDLADMRGAEVVKRILKLSAVGEHHSLLVGPPGSGKTMAAERLVTILPDLDAEQSVDVFGIHQLLGLMDKPPRRPPQRMPHHSLSPAGLIGGGTIPMPGEATLSHRGVLLLDEFLEFSRTTLDSLREPITAGEVCLARGGRSVTLPSKFLLIGTMNPCPCGQFGFGECRCLPSSVQRYWSRLSGPLLDRIDILAHVPVPGNEQTGSERGNQESETSADVQKWVHERRAALRERITGTQGKTEVGISDFHRDAIHMIQRYAELYRLSRRRQQSVVRLARTVSVCDNGGSTLVRHVEEALALRPTAFTAR